MAGIGPLNKALIDTDIFSEMTKGIDQTVAANARATTSAANALVVTSLNDNANSTIAVSNTTAATTLGLSGTATVNASTGKSLGETVTATLGATGTATLNGAIVWSSNTSRKAAVDQERVPLALRPGDNVLLFKLCTATDQWQFTVEVTPPGAGAFAGRVSVVPAAEFAGRKAFRQ